ncbi:MAG: CDP-alcohol phosphatidyltransferase family protein [Rhodoferax sp.]|jgi:CDP-diacylglycerol--glycerol-3-phosphate 3-phosphatidyltransferase|nr:CDP-alcohol phosphatidyltransferase family protein [Rhodoferax sp.]
MPFSIYQIKPQFQSLLRPMVQFLARFGVTANQVTVFACALSVALGLGLYHWPVREAFALVPLWMFLRMALNAVDGMLAREHGQQSKLGAFLNELTDVLADAALYLPFAIIAPFNTFWVAVVVLLSAMSELTGVLGQTVGASRRYDGPMGKSDRAFVFGVLALLVATDHTPPWLAWVMPLVAVLIVLNIVNRIRQALREAA